MDSSLPLNIIIIGASTGGCVVLSDIFSDMPPLDAAILIVQHMPKYINETFVRNMTARAQMPVMLAAHGHLMKHGTVLVAPADVHATLRDNSIIELVQGPKVNFVCPAIDVTMKSLKPMPFTRKLVGIVLTGLGRDGAEGIVHIKNAGGITIAQDRSTCSIPCMPQAAIETGRVDYTFTPENIVKYLSRLFGKEASYPVRSRIM